MHGVELVPLPEMLARIDRALAASPADHTAIHWLELGRAEATSGEGPPGRPPARERTVVVQVYERGRLGFHRTDSAEPGELEWAVRLALGQALTGPPGTAPARPDPAESRPASSPGGPSWDRDLARLAPEAAARLLGQGLVAGEAARLAWIEARLAAGETGGACQGFESTTAALHLACGAEPGAGRAASAARTLAGLAPADVLERARRRRSAEPVEATPPPALPLVLGAEAAGVLVEALARSLAGGWEGPIPLDPRLDLADDPAHPAALPFPVDLFGHPLARRQLLAGGRAVGPRIAPAAGDEPAPVHLVLSPGSATEVDLLAATGDGLFAGWIERIEALDDGGSAFRAHLAGTRWVRDGAFGPPAGPLVWEDRLDRLFAHLTGLGGRLVARTLGTDGLSAVASPALAFAEAQGLRPVP